MVLLGMDDLQNPLLLKELANDMYKVQTSLSKFGNKAIKYQLEELLEQRRKRWIKYIKGLYNLVGAYLKKLSVHISENTSMEFLPLLSTILSRIAPEALSKAEINKKNGNLMSKISKINEIWDDESAVSILKLQSEERKKNIKFLSRHSVEELKLTLLLLLFVEREEYESCLTEKERFIIQGRIASELLTRLFSGSSSSLLSEDLDQVDHLVKSAKRWLQLLDERSSMYEQYVYDEYMIFKNIAG
ncbi:unnamed protein product [Hymenolepis diminuta]|uniref:Uncharacterized protein n=1 Tax=Hymenolepis diminuta TaxID=6216 RepID=A0A0R3SKY1_HYMDI|nr:unnamed protein product [Hymenolepis diminuta]